MLGFVEHLKASLSQLEVLVELDVLRCYLGLKLLNLLVCELQLILKSLPHVLLLHHLIL